MQWPLSQELSPSHTHTGAWGAGDKWLWDSLSTINKPLAPDEWDRSAALLFYFTSLHLLRFGSFSHSCLVSSLILFPSGLSFSAILFSSLISLLSLIICPFLVSLTCLVVLSRLIIFTLFIVSFILFLSLIILSSFLFLSHLIIFFPFVFSHFFSALLSYSISLNVVVSSFFLCLISFVFSSLHFTASSLCKFLVSCLFFFVSYLVIVFQFFYISSHLAFYLSHLVSFSLVSSFSLAFFSPLVTSFRILLLICLISHSHVFIYTNFVTVLLSGLNFFSLLFQSHII